MTKLKFFRPEYPHLQNRKLKQDWWFPKVIIFKSRNTFFQTKFYAVLVNETYENEAVLLEAVALGT